MDVARVDKEKIKYIENHLKCSMNIENFYRKRITHAELYSINIPCLSKLLNSVGENEKKIQKAYT